ncbi:hypothetical protein FQZ97_882330 [compost metagenome]
MQVELDRAGHFDALAARTQAAETLGLGGSLHGDQVQFGEHRCGQLGEARITPRRTRRQPRIGQRDGNAAPGALMDMVRPQLGFHDHRQPRLHTVQETCGGPRQIVRQIAVLHPPGILRPGEHRLDALGAGRRHAGNGDRQLRVACQQLADQRRRGDALAHRYSMQPDATRLERWQAERETLANAFGIGRRLPRAPGETTGDDRQAKMEQQAVEGSIHGRAA